VTDHAPELQVSEWLNVDGPLTLAGLRGRVVVVHAFQMLCPGCILHAVPQAKAIREAFPESRLAVIGLHTVFEHHDAMTPAALKAFVHEFRIRHPIGIDRAAPGDPMPLTMQAYAMRGTPTLLVFDRQGRIRLDHFGHLDDLRVGAALGQLLGEAEDTDDAWAQGLRT